MHIRLNEQQINPNKVTALISFREKLWQVYFKALGCTLYPRLETFIALSLMPAMRFGEDIHADGTLSQRFIDNLPKIQDFFLNWKTHYNRIALHGVTIEPMPSSNEKRVGLFFSAGLDSFYTFLKHQDEITDLIAVHGFDFPLEMTGLRNMFSEAVHKIGDFYGKRVIEVESDALKFTQAYLPPHQVSSAFLAGIGYLMWPNFHKLYLATGHTYKTIDILESYHPDLDPLWSTESLQFIHDGLEATRPQKAAFVAKSPIALETLRVCVENRSGAYNCGKCPKCLRTMMNLRLVGALDACTTFSIPLDLKRVARMRETSVRRIFLEEILEELQVRGPDPDMEAAIHKAMSEPSIIHRLLRNIGKLRFKLTRRKGYHAPR